MSHSIHWLGAAQAKETREVFRCCVLLHVRAPFQIGVQDTSWMDSRQRFKTDGVGLCMNMWRKGAAMPKAKSKTKNTTSNPQNIPDSPHDYFAVDPGEANLAAVVHVVDGELQSKACLTRSRFREESHMNRNKRKRERYDRRVASVHERLANHTTKTHETSVFEEYLKCKKPDYDELWEHHASHFPTALRMDTHIHRQSCIDKFWQGALGIRRSPLMKYGAAAALPKE